MENFLTYDKQSFPLIFDYPSYVSYFETRRNKFSVQVNLRETKDKYRRLSPDKIKKYRPVGGGTIASVFPKISIALLKAYVPASHTATRKARFMRLDELVDTYIGGMLHPRNFCPDVIELDIEIPFGNGLVVAYKHSSNSFYRSQIFIADHRDEFRLLNILYRHIGTELSFDEQNHILKSIMYRDQDFDMF
jgi:hypothetical protein